MNKRFKFNNRASEFSSNYNFGGKYECIWFKQSKGKVRKN